jgi:hypothetical protein
MIRSGHLLFACVVLCGPAVTSAQEAPALPAHRSTISVGLSLTGGYPAGSGSAELRANAVGTLTPPPFTLFRADTAFDSGRGVELRVGYTLTRTLSIELENEVSQPRLTLAIAGDAEAGPQVLPGERITQFLIGGSAVWQISQAPLGRRARPYVTAGAAHLRQLHEDRTEILTGLVYHAGGGVRYWLGPADRAHRPLGIRAELTARVRRGGIEFESKSRAFPAFSVLAFVGL